ncbi:hypothetical protein [Dyadobacter sp. CY312]|uniref:hypothetical protein n=1 Tax=Dyadobacter sp. CY312 TaxID=2907303 RepID=UPI001F1C8FF1|nr:hypothetical protein [Dyadobacter sp. CY312]MCE7040648.1 hypothetical protein [Dyadobacter sp. CY312]
MKILIVVFGLLAWNGCEKQNQIMKSDVLEADAVWTNMLASDGCSWHFTVVQGDSIVSLAASDVSMNLIEGELGNIESAYSFTNVHIKYSPTGNNKNVQCGWGATAKMNEIDVLEIHKK